MNELLFLKEIDDLRYYSFHPSICRIYYPCYKGNEIPPYFTRLVHRIRMIRELYKSQYQVIYMVKNHAVIGHLVVGRGGSRLAMSTKHDIVIGPIWVVPSQRSNGYASKGINFILHNLGVDYDYAYEYIEKLNSPSIRTVQKNGFELVSECREYGLFKVIRPCSNGHLNVYRIENPRQEKGIGAL